MAKTEKNTVGTLEISFNRGNVMIVDHIRKVKAIIRQCNYACFFNDDDFVLLRKDDGTYGLYKAGFGFIIKGQKAKRVFSAHLKNFIAAIITSNDEFLLLDVEGNITKVNRNLSNYKSWKEFENGIVILENMNTNDYNILSSDLTLFFNEDLTLIGNETGPYMVLATDNGEGVYNVLNSITGEFIFADWKDYIFKTDYNDYLVWNTPTEVSIYDESFVLKETKTFDTEDEASLFEY